MPRSLLRATASRTRKQTIETPANPGTETNYSYLGDESFSNTSLDNTEADGNGLTQRDWHSNLLSYGQSGYYDTDFNSAQLRPGNRQGQMFIVALLLGLRITGDLRLLDEAIRLSELWYSNLATDASGYLYLPDATYDQGLDVNLESGVYARVMWAAHVNRALTSPAAYSYGTIADKYRVYLRDNWLPRWRGIEGTRFSEEILPDTAGFRHDYASVLFMTYALKEMGGGGGFTGAQWSAEFQNIVDYYFALDAECTVNSTDVLVMPFTLYPPSAAVGEPSFKEASGSLLYTTYVRYMISFMLDAWLEGISPTNLNEAWFTRLANSFAGFVMDTTESTNSLARCIGGDNPPGDARCGVPYNGTYRARVSSADARWQDSAFSYLEGFDSTGEIRSYGIQAWGQVGTYRENFPIYASGRMFTKSYFGSFS